MAIYAKIITKLAKNYIKDIKYNNFSSLDYKLNIFDNNYYCVSLLQDAYIKGFPIMLKD
jgi:hypothetical protein